MADLRKRLLGTSAVHYSVAQLWQKRREYVTAMHPSIIKTGSQLESTTYHSSQLGCPLCPKFNTKNEKTIWRHLNAHVKNAVLFQETIICRCNLSCRDTGHYHCPYCAKTIMRKEDMTLHVTGCQTHALPKPHSEPHPPLSALQDSIASAVSVDHSYTLSPSASLQSPAITPQSSKPPTASPPEASKSHAFSPEESFCAAAEFETIELPSSRVTNIKSVKCPDCSLVLYKKNLLVHKQRKHARPKDFPTASHLKSVFVDKTSGVFTIPKGTHGFCVPNTCTM
ncbi:TRMT1-like protein [Merluccius polli]|uniref:TRMT1-like protein n=1 Tax=Merluccius polli TaxID=89951 RepID=A0AA47P516_MERPO|nr:TRMT1-like protein [Merluccius polli]